MFTMKKTHTYDQRNYVKRGSVSVFVRLIMHQHTYTWFLYLWFFFCSCVYTCAVMMNCDRNGDSRGFACIFVYLTIPSLFLRYLNDLLELNIKKIQSWFISDKYRIKNAIKFIILFKHCKIQASNHYQVEQGIRMQYVHYVTCNP